MFASRRALQFAVHSAFTVIAKREQHAPIAMFMSALISAIPVSATRRDASCHIVSRPVLCARMRRRWGRMGKRKSLVTYRATMMQTRSTATMLTLMILSSLVEMMARWMQRSHSSLILSIYDRICSTNLQELDETHIYRVTWCFQGSIARLAQGFRSP